MAKANRPASTIPAPDASPEVQLADALIAACLDRYPETTGHEISGAAINCKNERGQTLVFQTEWAESRAKALGYLPTDAQKAAAAAAAEAAAASAS